MDVAVPAGHDPATPIPLVMLLQGYGVNGSLQSAYLGLPARVDTFGFALLAPDGTVDSQGLRFWNAGSSCCNFDGTDVDDVAYLRGLVAEAKQVLSIDPRRVYLIGHSNGGFMAHRMACDASDVVTGLASIAGSMTVDATCTPAHPVSVLLLHGTADADIGFEGGSIMGFDYLSAEDLLDRWVANDGCAELSVTDPTPVDYDLQVAGAETTLTSWTGCAGGARVDPWKMQGSGHIPPFTPAAKDAMLDRLLGFSVSPITVERP